MSALVNNICPKCGENFTGESIEFMDAYRVSQDVTCDGCGATFRHFYKLYDIEEV